MTSSVLNEASIATFAMGHSHLERLDDLADTKSDETVHKRLLLEVERFLSANLSGELSDVSKAMTKYSSAYEFRCFSFTCS